MFKNLMLYRLGAGWPASAQQLEQALAAEPFAPCSATQQKSSGWTPPRGHAHGALVEVVDGQWIIRLTLETKAVPGEAVRRHVDEQVEKIERESGRKPGKKELRDMRDDALAALLPQAFARQSHITAWIAPEQRWLVLDAGSQGKADELISSLVRVAGQGFEVSMLHTLTSPQAGMTAWLADPQGQALPDAFHIERECELKATGDEPAVVKFTRHPLQTEEVRQHIAEGKLPTRLALGWQGRVGFTLTQSLQLKKLRFLDGVLDAEASAGQATPADERFDADVALATGELRALIPDLLDALGGAADPAAAAAGFAPAPGAPGAPGASSTPSADPQNAGAEDSSAPF